MWHHWDDLDWDAWQKCNGILLVAYSSYSYFSSAHPSLLQTRNGISLVYTRQSSGCVRFLVWLSRNAPADSNHLSGLFFHISCIWHTLHPLRRHSYSKSFRRDISCNTWAYHRSFLLSAEYFQHINEPEPLSHGKAYLFKSWNEGYAQNRYQSH